MSEMLLDVSKHTLECLNHSKKSEYFCLAKNCSQRLFCFACIRHLNSHPHSLSEAENISQLFKVNSEKYSLTSSQISAVAASAVQISQQSQQKLTTVLEILKKFEILCTDPVTLNCLDPDTSLHSLISNSKSALKAEYEKLSLDTRVVDGPKINGLINLFLDFKDKATRLHQSKCETEQLQEILISIADVVEQLCRKIESLASFLEKVVQKKPPVSNNWQEQLDQIEFGIEIDQKSQYKKFQNPPNNSESESSRQKKESASKNIPVKTEIKEEEGSNPNQNNLKANKMTSIQQQNTSESTMKKRLPMYEALLAKTNRKPVNLPFPEPQKDPKLNQTSKQDIQPWKETEPTDCKSFFQAKNPLFDQNFLLRRISDFFDQTRFKPRPEDLSTFIGEASGEFPSLDNSQLEFRKMEKLVNKGKFLAKKCQEVLGFQDREGRDFSQRISGSLSYLFSKKDGKYLELKEMNQRFKIIHTNIISYVKEKMKEKETLQAIIKELSESRFDFEKEKKALQDLMKNSEDAIERISRELERGRSSGKKVKISSLTQRVLGLLEFPFKAGGFCKLLERCLSLQRFRFELVDSLEKFSAISKKGNAKATLEYRSLMNMITAGAFKDFDFETNAKEVLDQIEPKDSRNSLKENLPKEPTEKKQIVNGKTSPQRANSGGSTDNSLEPVEKNQQQTEPGSEGGRQNSSYFVGNPQGPSSISEAKNGIRIGLGEAPTLSPSTVDESVSDNSFPNDRISVSKEIGSQVHPYPLNLLVDKSVNQPFGENTVKKIKVNDGSTIVRIEF